MAAVSWLMIALATLVVFLFLPNKLHSQSDTTVFDFTRFDARDPNLILQGDALEFNGYISLTSLSVGRVLYSPPIRLWDRAGRRQANFQTVFRGRLCCAFEDNLLNGISFFMAPVNATIPMASTAGGNMGLYDASSGTSPVPFLRLSSTTFLTTGIQITVIWESIYMDSRNSDAVGRWDWETPNNTAYPWTNSVETRITYDTRQRLIFVIANATRFLSPTAPPLIGSVEYSYDLKTSLPEWVQIGFSSGTERPGQTSLVANQEILSWSFISFMVPDHDDVIRLDDDNSNRQYA